MVRLFLNVRIYTYKNGIAAFTVREYTTRSGHFMFWDKLFTPLFQTNKGCATTQ